MNRVYFLAPSESWIVDRFKEEWDRDNVDVSVQDPGVADVLWVCACWCWRRLPIELLKERKVLVTCHHYVPGKFNEQEFRTRDQVVTAYHVPNKHTYNFVRPLTQKHIEIIPYWANNKIWHKTDEKNELRQKHGIPTDGYIIGSAQRDTEGAGIPRLIFEPKLEKGPDLFADYVEKLMAQHRREPFHAYPSGPHVLLAGWRRQYLITRFKNSGVAFSYFELPSQEVLNELYQCLDLYAVTARQEGGPQSLIETGLLGIPVVSRDVGIASEVLPASAISNDVSLALPAVPNVERLKLPAGYEPYRRLIESL